MNLTSMSYASPDMSQLAQKTNQPKFWMFLHAPRDPEILNLKRAIDKYCHKEPLTVLT